MVAHSRERATPERVWRSLFVPLNIGRHCARKRPEKGGRFVEVLAPIHQHSLRRMVSGKFFQ